MIAGWLLVIATVMPSLQVKVGAYPMTSLETCAASAAEFLTSEERDRFAAPTRSAVCVWYAAPGRDA